MGLTTLADVTRMAGDLPGELQKAQQRGVRKAALIVTRAIRAEIRADSGGDMRLSGVGRKGARVGARYDVKGSINPTAIIRASGPLHFLEHDMPAHSIQPRAVRGRGSRKQFTGTRALMLRDGTFAASAQHPGSRAKRPFEKGWVATRGKTGATFEAEVLKAIRVVLR